LPSINIGPLEIAFFAAAALLVVAVSKRRVSRPAEDLTALKIVAILHLLLVPVAWVCTEGLERWVISLWLLGVGSITVYKWRLSRGRDRQG